ncbi:hypothetical protein KP004_04015 [Geomonas oryzisoli]|uniref:DUF4124 domain-containing protein n=1 Tax=Geomonas oryzisoli TaxID=2847992 RepID=A0ABX8JB36_9BACT|nr:hypothetical protein [Geomonas oryzisoli]QWV94361.1 hypothetical protein KP004_04015 [Geomonas oryzisoli]
MNKSLLFLLLGALTVCALPSRLLADYYNYTDNRGVVHMTNKLQAVPAKYRATMRVTREEPKKQTAAQAPEATEQAPASQSLQQEAPAPQPGGFAQLTSRHAWLKPLLIVAVIVGLFVAVCKLTTLIPSPMLSRVIYISFFVGVMVFLYKTYVDYMVESSMKIKDRAITMMKKSSNREFPDPAAGAPGEPRAIPMPASDSLNRQ